MTRRFVLSPKALLLAAGLAVAMPMGAFAQSLMSSTYGDLVVTISGNGSMGSRSTFAGIEATLGDHLVLIAPDSITVDGQSYPVTASSEVFIDNSDGFSVTVDGVSLVAESELAELMARADAGDAVAQLNLGVAYAYGEGVAEDPVRAAQYFRLAAEQGVPEAQSNLAYALYNGDGVENDDAEAMHWAGLAADQGNAIAMRLVAFGHYRGRGFPESHAEAARIWAEAANLGDDYSAYNMGIIVRDGDGVLQDDALAILWFERAAELGHPDAEARLAEMRGQ